MKRFFKNKGLAAALLGAALCLPGIASAGVVWNEKGLAGAGDLLNTAQVTYDSSFNALDAITGALTTSVAVGGNPLYQVDLYKIRINAATFSARTTSDSDFDTALYLFDAAGHGVYSNDDADGLLSLLPSGHGAGPLSDGVYYLAVAVGGFIAHDASNLASFLSGGSNDVLGGDPTAGPLAGWTEGFLNFEEAARSYRIALTGATNGELPEPASLGLLLAAGLGAVAARRSARKS